MQRIEFLVNLEDLSLGIVPAREFLYEFYVMEPLTDKVLSYVAKPLKQKGTVGDVRVADPDGDGTYEVLFGSSVLNGNEFGRIEFSDTYTHAKLFSYPIQQKNIGKCREEFVLNLF